VDEDHVFFEREKQPVLSDSQTICALLSRKLLHVALQIGLERVEFLADAVALLLFERPQLLARLIAKFEPATNGRRSCRHRAVRSSLQFTRWRTADLRRYENRSVRKPVVFGIVWTGRARSTTRKDDCKVQSLIP
jgi:hypothetical protein